ncbi:MAG: HAMP domain-containing histidine kinase [Pseudomonadota bacterium]|nr:HAMP domain-containing histidine kinase [Pseudomonadota bacterium]
MRLAQFILQNVEPILIQWEAFAKALPPGLGMSSKELRNDAERMLRFVAADMETPQSLEQQARKAQGHGPDSPEGVNTAAHDHGLQRLAQGFTLDQMISEYRAIRASVTYLWTRVHAADGAMSELIRFNEAVDQILAESVLRFNRKLDRDKDLFIAILGHDLRNPLQAVGMSAEALVRDATLGTSARESATRIARSNKRMQTMVSDLLDFTRTRLGADLPLRIEECDLIDICRRIVTELQVVHPDRSLHLHAQGDCGGDWDASRIEQLLSNLAGNAIQHGLEGSPVDVTTHCEPDHVSVSVHNFGPAIPADRHEAIFNPLNRPTTENGGDDNGSLGLGLYIAREIARAHGGKVTFTSSDESGTCFTVRLPRRLPAGPRPSIPASSAIVR